MLTPDAISSKTMRDYARLMGAAPAPRPSLPPLDPEPPFPLHVLPEPWAAWLGATASATRVPAGCVGLPLLALAGAAIGNQVRLQIAPGWHELGMLWVALVAPTGSGKSPAIAAARAPFDAFQHDAWTAWKEARRAWQGSWLRSTPAPRLPRLFAPLPSLGLVAAAHLDVPGLALVADELHGFVRSIDRHGGVDRQCYLSLWSGDPLLSPDPTVTASILSPVVAIVGGIQPVLLSRVARSGQDGFLERFLFVRPDNVIRPWDDTAWDAPGPGSLVAEVARLRAIVPTPGDQVTVTLAPEARPRWADWFATNTDHLATATPRVGNFYRKMPSHLARLALVLHVLWEPDPTVPLSAATLDRAIELQEYARLHMHRVAGCLGQPVPAQTGPNALAARIVDCLTTAEEPGWIARTTLLAALGRPETSCANETLAGLIERGTVEQRTDPARGRGRRAVSYRLVPDPGKSLSGDDPQEFPQELNAVVSGIFEFLNSCGAKTHPPAITVKLTPSPASSGLGGEGGPRQGDGGVGAKRARAASGGGL